MSTTLGRIEKPRPSYVDFLFHSSGTSGITKAVAGIIDADLSTGTKSASGGRGVCGAELCVDWAKAGDASSTNGANARGVCRRMSCAIHDNRDRTSPTRADL